MKRRDAVRLLGASAAGAALGAAGPRDVAAGAGTMAGAAAGAAAEQAAGEAHRAPFQQSFARWCFARTPIETLCEWSRDLGFAGVDLLGEDEWAVPARYGLTCTMGNSFGTIADGFNRPDLHDQLVAAGEAYIPKAAAAGVTRIVVFSGNRRGMSDGEGIVNCITGLHRLMPTCERHGVTLCMEMLNSKVDHRDYHADRTEWAVQVARGIDSPHFRLLYDIYHMQVMEGDVIATIRKYGDYIAHYHTAGVPGRHEIGDEQELHYPAIARAIAATGYAGIVAHEFLPRGDALAALREAAERTTVA